MTRGIAHCTLLVRDYDEAIAWYVEKLGFRVVDDRPVPAQGKRWVLIAANGENSPSLLLARAVDARQAARIGDQTGGRVFAFLQTDDFWREHAAMCAAGVQFEEPPRVEPYGIVAVWRDLYGNRWDLLEYVPGPPA